MDRALAPEEQRRQFFKNGWWLLIAVLVLIAGFYWFRNSLKSSVPLNAIRTGVVEMGPVENALNASGEIMPESEQLVTSPIDAVIQKVNFEAGSVVKPGQPILVLDKEYTQLEYEKLKDQLELKRNSIIKQKLELQKSIFDMQVEDSIKLLQINSLTTKVEDAKRLQRVGGGTREEVEQAQLNLRIAQIEKKQLENNLVIKQQTIHTDMKESELQAGIQEKDIRELGSKLSRADILASRAGVLTWVNQNIGSTIREGESLARIADLGSFRVKGAVSDQLAEQVHVGMPAIVRVNETDLRGSVSNIQPSVQNSVVSFDVRLDTPNSPVLRPNMKVEVFLVTASKARVLRVANGPAFNGRSVVDVFVINGKKANRRTVHTGLSNLDYIEILDHLQPGEKVIVSDMSDYKHLNEIEIK